MKKSKRTVFSLIAVLIVTVLALSGCGSNVQSPGSTPEETQPSRPTNAMGYTYNAPDGVINSSTDELIDDFIYLLNYPFTYVPCDKETIMAQNYDDIVTLFVAYEGETSQELWIYDAKRNAVFYGNGPYKPELLSYYDYMHELSAEEKEELINTLKEADTHEWEEYYPGEENDWTSYFGAIRIEYKTGVFEYHSGSYSNKDIPENFNAIHSLFDSYDYISNPLCENSEQ